MLRSVLTAAAAAAVCCALAAPAHAQLTVTADDRGDSVREADLKKVTVHHGDRRVHLTSRMYKGSRLPDEVWHLVDTRGDDTPDFLVFAVVTSEVTDKPSVEVYAVDRWPTRKNPYRLLRSGEPVDCGLKEGRRAEGYKLLRLTLGRGCFASDDAMPDRVRVNTFQTYEWGKITDKAPRWGRYGRWTPAG
ncbi:MAG: hypothetical protein ACXWDL_05510 [Nocardioides sp.]